MGLIERGTEWRREIQNSTAGSKARRALRCPRLRRSPANIEAPLEPANFNGPGSWLLLCLDHVREHNAKYNYFEGMTPDEISEAQIALWRLGAPDPRVRDDRRGSRRRRGATSPIRSTRSPRAFAAAGARRRRSSRFSQPERRALSVLGLAEDADRHALRSRYSQLVRRYHPDSNGGDRSHERQLGEVIEAYQLLRKAAAFA